MTVGAALMALVLVVRFLPPDRYHIYPFCPFRALTGLYCPGCGSTHAMAALLAGRWSEAWHSNALAVILFPVIGVFLVPYFYTALRYNCGRAIVVPPLAGKAAVAATLLFGLLRNLTR